MMIWVCTLLCPNDHDMATGFTQAPDDENRTAIAESFISYIYDDRPHLDCEGCGYKLKENAQVRVHILTVNCETVEEARAALRRGEFKEENPRKLKLDLFIHRSRN